ncbi:MAG: cupin domain-containing protein [Pseudomonadota bacterium]
MAGKINLAEKFALFDERWAPRLAARYNGNEVRLAKLEGDFHWHQHDATDELFLVIEGELDIEFRDRTETLKAGEMIVVPRCECSRRRA